MRKDNYFGDIAETSKKICVSLRKLIEEIEDIKKEFPEGDCSVRIVMILKQLEDRVSDFSDFEKAAELLAELEQKTEERVMEILEFETVIYPKTKFGVSRFANLVNYSELMPFAGNENNEGR